MPPLPPRVLRGLHRCALHGEAAAAAAAAARRGLASTGGATGGRALPPGVPSLREFMAAQQPPPHHPPLTVAPAPAPVAPAVAPAVGPAAAPAAAPTFYLETYGCAMNSSDSEIVHAVLQAAGYARTAEMGAADVVLANTCAIREGAERTVWHRLDAFAAVKRARAAAAAAVASGAAPPSAAPPRSPLVIGVLGCMAERLKGRLLASERALVDVVAGPDAYRDLPRLVALVRAGADEPAVNVALSTDETYADIVPVRGGGGPPPASAYVSIARGCSNMCSFCVVPFTRGRERSRDAGSIVDEVARLADAGVREVTLLGQNVNSYHDVHSAPGGRYADGGYVTAAGFSNMFRARHGVGVRFTELLDRVSAAAPGVRLRFTSPHPKDFPDDLLALLAERDNLAKHVHLPAQSGSTAVLAAMRRGYSRDAYTELAARVRARVPGVSLSTDMIAGFCGEREEDHELSVALMAEVRFENAFMFAYSRRERTHAAYRLADDVPPDVKLRRLHEVIAAFRGAVRGRLAADVGSVHLVLVEGAARKSTPELPLLSGRTDCNKRAVLPAGAVPAGLGAGGGGGVAVELKPGDWVAVRVTGIGETSLIVAPLARVDSLPEFYAWRRAGGGGGELAAARDEGRGRLVVEAAAGGGGGGGGGLLYAGGG